MKAQPVNPCPRLFKRLVVLTIVLSSVSSVSAVSQCNELYLDTLVTRMYYGILETGYISSDIRIDSIAIPTEGDTTILYYYTHTGSSGTSTGSFRQLRNGLVEVGRIDNSQGVMYCWICIPIDSAVQGGNIRLVYVADVQSSVLGTIETVRVYRQFYVDPDDTSHVVPSGLIQVSPRYGIVRELDSETLSLRYELVAAEYDGKHYGLPVSVAEERALPGHNEFGGSCGLATRLSNGVVSCATGCGGEIRADIYSVTGALICGVSRGADKELQVSGYFLTRTWCLTHKTARSGTLFAR